MIMQSVICLAVAAVGGGLYFLAKFLLSDDTRVNEQQRRAIQLSLWAKSNGLPNLGRLLEAYAVGDFLEVANSAQGQGTIDRFLNGQLEDQLSTEKGRKDFADYIKRQFGVELTNSAIGSLLGGLICHHFTPKQNA